MLDGTNTASNVWADNAYRSAEMEEELADRGLRSRFNRKAYHSRPLDEVEKMGNRTR